MCLSYNLLLCAPFFLCVLEAGLLHDVWEPGLSTPHVVRCPINDSIPSRKEAEVTYRAVQVTYRAVQVTYRAVQVTYPAVQVTYRAVQVTYRAVQGVKSRANRSQISVNVGCTIRTKGNF